MYCWFKSIFWKRGILHVWDFSDDTATPCRRTLYIRPRGCKEVFCRKDEATTSTHPPRSDPNNSSHNSRQRSWRSFSIQIYLEVKTSTALFANFQGGKLNQATVEECYWLSATLKAIWAQRKNPRWSLLLSFLGPLLPTMAQKDAFSLGGGWFTILAEGENRRKIFRNFLKSCFVWHLFV